MMKLASACAADAELGWKGYTSRIRVARCLGTYRTKDHRCALPSARRFCDCFRYRGGRSTPSANSRSAEAHVLLTEMRLLSDGK